MLVIPSLSIEDLWNEDAEVEVKSSRSTGHFRSHLCGAATLSGNVSAVTAVDRQPRQTRISGGLTNLQRTSNCEPWEKPDYRWRPLRRRSFWPAHPCRDDDS
jgi:hypothetical protein